MIAIIANLSESVDNSSEQTFLSNRDSIEDKFTPIKLTQNDNHKLYNGVPTLLYNLTGHSPRDFFGIDISIDGNYLVISAVGFSSKRGAVYVYDLYTGHLLYNFTGTNEGDNIGFRVMTKYPYLVTSTPTYPNNTNYGMVSVYNITNGKLLYRFNGSGKDEKFGFNFDLDLPYLAVGASGFPDGTYRGRVNIYDLTKGTLIRSFYGENTGDTFGLLVDLNGIYLGTSAIKHNQNHGKAYIYNILTGNCIFNISGPYTGAYFAKVIINYPIAVFYSTFYSNQKGIVLVYRLFSNYISGERQKQPTGKLLYNFTGNEQEDLFGWSVALSNNYLSVGSVGYPLGTYHGAVYLYDLTDGSLKFKLYGKPGFQLGHGVDLDSKYFLVTGYGYDLSGILYLYDLNNLNLLVSLNGTNGGLLGFSWSLTDNFLATSEIDFNQNEGLVYLYRL